MMEEENLLNGDALASSPYGKQATPPASLPGGEGFRGSGQQVLSVY